MPRQARAWRGTSHVNSVLDVDVEAPEALTGTSTGQGVLALVDDDGTGTRQDLEGHYRESSTVSSRVCREVQPDFVVLIGVARTWVERVGSLVVRTTDRDSGAAIAVEVGTEGPSRREPTDMQRNDRSAIGTDHKVAASFGTDRRVDRLGGAGDEAGVRCEHA